MINNIKIAGRVDYMQYYPIRDAWGFRELAYEKNLKSEFLLTTNFPSISKEKFIDFLKPYNHIHLINFHRGMHLSDSREVCKDPELVELLIVDNVDLLKEGDIFFVELFPESKPQELIKQECNSNFSYFDCADFIFDGNKIQLGRLIIDRKNIFYYNFKNYNPLIGYNLCILYTVEI